jgi:hypothetical protein
MIGRNWLLFGVLATILGTTGCITAGYEGAKLAREAGPECDIPLTQRNQVYIFVIGGNNPLESTDMDEFRRDLNKHGFAKVATGPAIYYSWMLSEMRRIHSEETNAVFVVAGLDSSASTAVKLSDKVTAEGIPILGVVIADPSGQTEGPRSGLRALFVGRGGSPGTINSTESRQSEVVQFLNEVAMKNPLPYNNDVVSEWRYPFATDTLTSIEPKNDSEWGFMFDRVGGVTRGIADPVPSQTTTPSSVYNTAFR